MVVGGSPLAPSSSTSSMSSTNVTSVPASSSTVRQQSPPVRCLVCQCELRGVVEETARAAIANNTASVFTIDDDDSESSATPAADASPSSSTSQSGTRNLMHIIGDSKHAADAPVCKECAEVLLNGMDDKLALLEEECRVYKNLVETLQKEHEGDDPERIRQQLREAKDEEEKLAKELASLEAQEAELNRQLEQKKKKLATSSENEEELWRKFRDNHRAMLEMAERGRAVDAETRYAASQLRRLEETSALNLAFHIWTDGPFVLINGFRFGRLPIGATDRPVEWNEVNAAWGHAALLLSVLISLFEERFKVKVDLPHKIVPLGNHSYIKVRRDNKEVQVPLHGHGNWKPFGNQNTDAGAVAFLDCLHVLHEAIKSRDPSFRIAYPVVRDKLRDTSAGMEFSAKMQFNSEERWTKAMGFMLIDLKWAQAWATTVMKAIPS